MPEIVAVILAALSDGQGYSERVSADAEELLRQLLEADYGDDDTAKPYRKARALQRVGSR